MPGEKQIRFHAGEAARIVLAVIGMTGVVIAGAMFPGLLHLVPRKHRQQRSPAAFKRVMYRLDKRGWIVIKQTRQGWKVSLTAKGHEAFLAYQCQQKKIQKPKKWDGKWRVLVFDVPEERKFIRDGIRYTLRALGFIRLQDSVWVHPYECREVLDLLRTKYRVRHEALYMRVEALSNDRWLRREFDFPA